jgi:hypothetical protein
MVNIKQTTVTSIQQLIQDEIESITVDTISLENLASDLLESDVDKYLALKDESPSQMSKSEKYNKASELLAEQASKKGRKAAVDKHFYEMAKELRVIATRAEKETELHTAIRQTTSPHRLKDNVKKLRTEIKTLEGYEEKVTQKELKEARSQIKERKAEKRRKNLVVKADKFVKDVTPKLQNTAYYTEILASLQPLLDKATQIAKKAEEKAREEQARLQAETKTRLKNEEEQEQVKQSVSV